MIDCLSIRSLTPNDYDIVSPLLDEWWGGRPMRSLLPRLFFEHFCDTSFVVGAPGEVKAFLVGFRSGALPHVGYIHFVGVHPGHRRQGLARTLYARFFATVLGWRGTEVHCITSPANRSSIAYHQALGFEVLPGTGKVGDVDVFLDHAGPGEHRVRFRKVLAPVAQPLSGS